MYVVVVWRGFPRLTEEQVHVLRVAFKERRLVKWIDQTVLEPRSASPSRWPDIASPSRA